MNVETHLPLGKVDPGCGRHKRLSTSATAAARVVEELNGLGLTETKEDPHVVMVAASTTRIDLTTAMAMAFPFGPTGTAMTAWTLQRGSRGASSSDWARS